MGISSTSYTLCGVDPLPVWVLRTRELGSSAPIRVVQVDRESRVLVSVHAKRAGLVNLGEYLVEWSSPAHVCHENRLREAPDWCCPRDEIGDVLSELHVKARFRIFACTSLFVLTINESEYVRPGLRDFNEINLAVRKSAEASFELFGFGLAEPAISIDDHSSDGLARLLLVFLDAPFQEDYKKRTKLFLNKRRRGDHEGMPRGPKQRLSDALGRGFVDSGSLDGIVRHRTRIFAPQRGRAHARVAGDRFKVGCE